MNEKVKIADALDISVREVPTVSFVSSKAFLLDVGYDTRDLLSTKERML